MTPPRSRRLLTLLAAAGALAVVALGGVYWQDIAARVRFYWLFESVGLNDQGLSEYRHRQTGIVMVRVRGGTFMMGTSEAEAERLVTGLTEVFNFRAADGLGRLARKALQQEQPRHEVTLGSFLIAKYEVTQPQWRTVMRESPSRFKGELLPVEQVSWEDCKKFTSKTGFSLPTEAQWEYACRAGTEGAFAGAGNPDDMAWYVVNSGNTTHSVGQKQPNDFGLHDTHGNVAEWCADAYDEEFYSKPAALRTDPVASGSEFRVCRGGCWRYGSRECRSAFRDSRESSYRFGGLGFRPAFYPLPPGL